MSLFPYAFTCNQFVAPKTHHSRRHCSIQDLIKKLVFEGYIAKTLTDAFLEKSWTKLGANKLLKSCGTQAQLTGGQAAADLTVLTLKKMLRQLMI